MNHCKTTLKIIDKDKDKDKEKRKKKKTTTRIKEMVLVLVLKWDKYCCKFWFCINFIALLIVITVWYV